jgi:hypothetical protein
MNARVTVRRKMSVETAQKISVVPGPLGDGPTVNEPCHTTRTIRMISRPMPDP